MRQLRSILPLASLNLCLGFFALIAVEGALLPAREKTDPTHAAHLVIHPEQSNAAGVFALLATDEEVEDSDSEGRAGTFEPHYNELISESKKLSALYIQADRSTGSPIPCGSRTLLYRRLII